MSNSIQTSARSRKIRNHERIARGILWFLSGMTIAVLALIIGYLMVKGLRYNNTVPYDVTNRVDTQIPLGGDIEDAVFIINRNVRSRDITVDSVQTLYNEVRTENW